MPLSETRLEKMQNLSNSFFVSEGGAVSDFVPTLFAKDQTPPRRELKVSDPSVRDLTLYQLQLSPSSVLMLSFFDEALNRTSCSRKRNTATYRQS